MFQWKPNQQIIVNGCHTSETSWQGADIPFFFFFFHQMLHGVDKQQLTVRLRLRVAVASTVNSSWDHIMMWRIVKQTCFEFILRCRASWSTEFPMKPVSQGDNYWYRKPHKPSVLCSSISLQSSVSCRLLTHAHVEKSNHMWRIWFKRLL